MRLKSTLPELTTDDVRRILRGLPDARGYKVTVKPLRYRQKPHLSALTDYDAREIVLQLPEPFLPFGEVVYYAAKRKPAKGIRFVWLSEGVTFERPRDVLRFLYCHEWMHWYLRERLGQKGMAETACDRFALWNYRRRSVTEADALYALKPPRN